MAHLLGITWIEAVSAAIATIGIYLTLLVLVKLVGQRSLATMASFDLGAAVAIGAILGRTALLERPTLAAGVIVMATFFAFQGAVGLLRTNRRLDRLINRSPVLLMAGSRVLTDNLRRAHMTQDELRQVLRLAGVAQLAEVSTVTLERNGRVSVIRRSRPVDPWLLADVEDRALVLAGSEAS